VTGVYLVNNNELCYNHIMKPKTDLGQTAEIILPEITRVPLVARVDTGAKTSAIWVSQVTEVKEGLEIVFFGEGVPHYDQKTVIFKDYSDVVVTSSNGISELRFKIKLSCKIAGRVVRAWFTLADRSSLTYPVLLGRNLLRGKFIVDVSVANTELPLHQTKQVATTGNTGLGKIA
jgi:hypothetical protein